MTGQPGVKASAGPMTTAQSGYLLIADITGYTAYLSASELEHAQGTLTSLLELLIEHTRPPLIISQAEAGQVLEALDGMLAQVEAMAAIRPD